ncbi:hypothetical protein Gxy13693_018_013 [Komagataeibacter xylinus NBRC 13693]|uniref:Uncharacterized protein n=2 Tax=Komagataeibacter xylinus TaxID=28448 RepID=A0A0D6Q765_KOMXY|nr:hypothetical protein Gxy13693_018_013 [Komagataeibacter xylinus NBRC 13693]
MAEYVTMRLVTAVNGLLGGLASHQYSAVDPAMPIATLIGILAQTKATCSGRFIQSMPFCPKRDMKDADGFSVLLFPTLGLQGIRSILRMFFPGGFFKEFQKCRISEKTITEHFYFSINELFQF